jgi:hypothetical protein
VPAYARNTHAASRLEARRETSGVVAWTWTDRDPCGGFLRSWTFREREAETAGLSDADYATYLLAVGFPPGPVGYDDAREAVAAFREQGRAHHHASPQGDEP